MHFPAVGEEQAQSRAELSSPKELDGGGSARQVPRLAALPDLCHCSLDAIGAAVKDPIRPALAAGILRIDAEDVTAGLQDTLRHRLTGLGQEQNRAAAGVDLRDELGETGGVVGIEARAWLAGVRVAAGDRRTLVPAGQFDR